MCCTSIGIINSFLFVFSFFSINLSSSFCLLINYSLIFRRRRRERDRYDLLLFYIFCMFHCKEYCHLFSSCPYFPNVNLTLALSGMRICTESVFLPKICRKVWKLITNNRIGNFWMKCKVS